MSNYSTLLKSYIAENPNELTPKQILELEHEIKHPDTDTTSDEFLDFKLWCIGYPSRQEKFAEFLTKKLPEHSKILEVGCGRTAKLSRILSQKGFDITALDPKLDVSYSNNIKFIKKKFDKNYDVSMYDYIIGQEPCDATEHIVRACTNQNIPFIMSVCGVPHKLISGQTPKNVDEWYKYLMNISNSIKIRFIKFDPFTITVILKNF